MGEILFKAKTMHAAMSANIAKGDPKSDNMKGLTEVSDIISSLITTIESQKEEMLECIRRDQAERHELFLQIQSLKAITELAVKEKSELFDESVRQKKRAILAEKQLKLATIGLNYILSFPYLDSTEDIRIIKRNSSDVLEANVRLQNVQT